VLSLEELQSLAGPHAAAIDEGTRDQIYAVADSILDAFEVERRHVATAASKARTNPFLRLVPIQQHEDVEERAAIREFEGGQPRDEAERAALYDLGFGGGE